ncbi:MAG: PASTA domain-containing protein [Gemmatimonadales bacterium]
MRTRRHTASGPLSLPATPLARFARDLGLIALTFVVGYAASVYWITPRSASGEVHAVPRVLGQPLDSAKAALAAIGFRARMDGQRPGAVPSGGVLWQDPPPGTAMPPNAAVQLVLSEGPPPATVPDVIGFALPAAAQVLEAAGLKLGRADTVRGGATEAGVVIATRPAPGNGRPRGAAVDLVVSGPPGSGS